MPWCHFVWSPEVFSISRDLKSRNIFVLYVEDFIWYIWRLYLWGGAADELSVLQVSLSDKQAFSTLEPRSMVFFVGLSCLGMT